MDLHEKNIVFSVKNLEVGYLQKKNRISIAKGINFSLQKGQLIGLVGANGIGKSTLLRTLTGMQPALKGEIFVNGKNLDSYSPFELASQLSVVLTEPPVSKNLTVEELISLGRQPYTNWIGTLSTEDKSAISAAIKATATEEIKDKKCYELSDGQLQRILIARALAQDTPIIILDEPTTHLDLYHTAYILKLLKDLAQKTQKLILFSTHEIDLAIQLTDKLIIMTDTATHYDEPCRLIENGIFEALFPPETIAFDPASGRFIIKK